MSAPEPWLDGARAALERRIEATSATPDFLDVVARAHALDATVVSEDALHQADGSTPAPVMDAEGEHRSIADEATFDGWLGDVRAAVERRVDERRRGPLPVLSVPSRDRRISWWLGGAVAAAVALALGAGPMMRMMRSLSEDASTPAELAVHQRDGSPSTGDAEPVTPATAPDPEPQAELPMAATTAPEPALEPALEPAETDASPTRTASRGDRLAELARRAQAHWRAGRPEEARRLFARIVAEGGRTRAAEMAYADLFTLAHQAADTQGERSWWRGYLRRFPRGRFADDAQAGLCRTSSRAERAGCWSKYLVDFAQGSFRAEARAFLGKPSP